MADKWKQGAASMQNAFGTPPAADAAPEQGDDKKKEDEDDSQSGGVYQSLMQGSQALGGAMGGGAVYNTLKKVMK